jgi:hypothetical protein
MLWEEIRSKHALALHALHLHYICVILSTRLSSCFAVSLSHFPGINLTAKGSHGSSWLSSEPPWRMSKDALEDGRDSAERACTHLACAAEHCLQQHRYQMTQPCARKWELYEQCVAEQRARLADKSSRSTAALAGKAAGT